MHCLREFLARQLFNTEIVDCKLANVEETKRFVEIEEGNLSCFFHDLEPSHTNAVEACKVSKVWVG